MGGAVEEWSVEVPGLELRDPLGEFLGAIPPGTTLRYHFIDAVKLCGHSCPTVARAWLMTAAALKALHRSDEVPVRGNMAVELGGERDDGATGPTSMVVGLLTGAAPETGFGGLMGQFRRQGLLSFRPELSGSMRFHRLDTGQAVQVDWDRTQMPAPPVGMGELMNLALTAQATAEQQRRFGELWQQRVRALFTSPDACLRVTPLNPS